MDEGTETGFFFRKDSPLEKFASRFFTGGLFIGMTCVVFMMLLTVVHAVGRYGFNFPIPGLVEMSSFLLVIIIFFSAPYTETVKSHIAVGILVDNFPPRAQEAINVIGYLLGILLATSACWRTIVRALFVKQCGYVTAILDIPHYPFVFFAAIGWALLGIAFLFRLIGWVDKVLRRRKI